MASSSSGSLPTESSPIISLPPSSVPPTTTSASSPDPPPPSTTTSSTSPPTLLPPTTTTSSTTLAPPPIDTSTSSSTDTSTSFTSTTTTTTPSTSSSTGIPVTPITSPTTTTPSTPITNPSTITVITQVSSNSAVTTTSVLVVGPSSAVPSNSPQSSNSGSGFFHNKGAVAGVFTVVGLIVFAVLIALITNCIRRRRAKKFDDEIAAAAHDAANAQVPNFGYEDEFQPGGGASYGTNNGAKYSDISHGTYTQPPMAIPESYGMRELPHGHGPAPAPGEYLDPGRLGYGADAAAAGAAGIGVARARSMRDGSYAAGLQEGASPYVAFAYPNTRNNPDNGPQYPPGMIRGTGGPEFDLQRRPSQYTQQSGSDYSSTVFSKTKSLTGTLPTSTHSHHSEPSHLVPNNTGVDEYQGYPSSFRIYGNKVATYSGGVTGGDSHLPPIPSEENLNSAYDGYVADESDQPKNSHQANTAHPVPDQLPNPFSANDQYDDETDEDEAEQPKRILKVANE